MATYIQPRSKLRKRRASKEELKATLPQYSMGGSILSGTLSGAAAGAAIAPPWGAVAGAAIGLTSGIIKGKKEQNALQEAESEQRLNTARQQRLGEYEGQTDYQSIYSYAKGGTVKADPSLKGLKKRAYETVGPRGYTTDPDIIKEKATSFIKGKPRISEGDYREELWAKGLGSTQPLKHIYPSTSKPTTATDSNAEYYSLKNIDKQYFLSNVLSEFQGLKSIQQDKDTATERWTGQSPSTRTDLLPDFIDKSKLPQSKSAITHQELPLTVRNKGLQESIISDRKAKGMPTGLPSGVFKKTDVLGDYKVFKGKDEKGNYVGYYDKWDFANPIANKIVSPTELYEKMYYKENPNYRRFSADNPNKYKMFNPNVERYATGGISQGNAMMGQPNAEVEDEETLQYPNGQYDKVDGRTHEEGGEEVNLPEQTRVYSDKLKVPGTKQSFAEANTVLASKIEKIENAVNNKETQPTRIAKRTAGRNIKNLRDAQDKLFATQQELNGEAEKERQQQAAMAQMQAQQGAPGQMMPPQGVNALDRPQMASQGPSMQPPQGGGLPQGKYGMQVPQYSNGGYGPSNPYQLNYYGDNARKWVGNVEGQFDSALGADYMSAHPSANTGIPSYNSNPNYNETFNKGIAYKRDLAANPQNYTGDLTGTQPASNRMQAGQPSNINQPSNDIFGNGFDAQVSVAQNYNVPAIENPAYQGNDQIGVGQPFQTKGGVDAMNTDIKAEVPSLGSKIGGYASAAATLAPMVYNMFAGKPETIKPSYNYAGAAAAAQMRGKRYNIEPSLNASRVAFNTAMRNVSSRSRGEQMANMSALATGKATADSAIFAQKQNIENQYDMAGLQTTAQVGAQDAAAEFRAADWNARSRAGAQNQFGASLTGLSKYAQMKEFNKNTRAADKMKMNSLEGIYSMFDLDEGGSWTLNQEKMNEILGNRNKAITT